MLQIHFEDEIRGLALTSDSNYDDFMRKIAAKFGLRAGDDFRVRFKDEDGSMIGLVDEVRPSSVLASTLAPNLCFTRRASA